MKRRSGFAPALSACLMAASLAVWPAYAEGNAGKGGTDGLTLAAGGKQSAGDRPIAGGEEASQQKISRYVAEKVHEVGPSTPLEVLVGISDPYNLQEFAAKQSIVAVSDITFVTTRTFMAKLTAEQMNLLCQREEVFWISLPSEITTVAQSAPGDTDGKSKAAETPVPVWISAGTGHGQNQEVAVFYTDEGGKNWKKSVLPKATATDGRQFVHFVDKNNGYILLTSSPGLGQMVKELYQTTDGGKSWHRIGDITSQVESYPTGMTFRTVSEGWISSVYHGQDGTLLFHTADGGKTWKQQMLDVPPILQDHYSNVYPPVFFGQDKAEGVVMLEFVKEGSSLYLPYFTEDGGRSWHYSKKALEAQDNARQVQQGTVSFQMKEGEPVVKLPLYGIAADYAVDWPEPVSITPKSPLPPVRFEIPAGLQQELAAYWINQGDGEHGILLLGPKDWKVVAASIGANGSIGIRLQDPVDEHQTLSYYDTSGGCQGCAISSVATYFPSLREWAEEQAFPGEPMTFQKQTLLTPNVMAYAKENPFPGYETNGMAFQQHGEGSAWFRAEEISIRADKHDLAAAILDFFAARYGQPEGE
ncbi:DUF4850 domain-containing protein [Brevibacillus sp. B_LB10_24]|uniref:DUF4850 domain-containing protein n=1 Tax=Brevibacillus sp. B_LB10_24 TaxID=3380645 RepID=UPI0038BA0BB8